MNNHRKYKKKKSKVQNLGQLQHDEEKMAADNLFNISHLDDVLNHQKQLNPESNIFNSVDLDENHSLSHSSSGVRNTLPHPDKSQKSHLNSKFSNIKNDKILELQKLMDKQFIRQSKLLLKLYTSMPNQSETFDSNLRLKKTHETNKIQSRKKKLSIVCSSFKSESVFVVKKQKTQEPSLQKEKFHITTILSQKKIIKPKVSNQSQMNSQFQHPHRNYFQSTSKKAQSKSLSPIFQTNFSTNSDFYEKLQKFKTFNSINWLMLGNSIQNSKKNLRLKPQSRALMNTSQTSNKFTQENDSHLKTQTTNNSSFRKRLTFYKSQKNKRNHSQNRQR